MVSNFSVRIYVDSDAAEAGGEQSQFPPGGAGPERERDEGVLYKQTQSAKGNPAFRRSIIPPLQLRETNPISGWPR